MCLKMASLKKHTTKPIFHEESSQYASNLTLTFDFIFVGEDKKELFCVYF